MDLIARIEELKHQWDYPTALALYMPYATNQVLLAALQARENSFTTRKLREGLNDLKLKLQAETKKAVAQAENIPQDLAQDQAESKLRYQTAPLEVQALISERMHLYKQYQVKKHKIREPKLSKSARGALAHECLELMDRVNEIWQMLDYFETNGQLPPTKQTIKVELTDKADLMRRRATLRSYLSKIKAGRLSANKKEIYESELTEIERKLN